MHRAAIPVVAGIFHVLKVRTDLPVDGTGPLRKRSLDLVIGLENALVAVVQMSVADQEALTSRGQILLLGCAQGFARHGNAQAIIAAMPVAAGQLGAKTQDLIDLGKSKAFLLAVIPSPAQKGAGIAVVGQRLLEIEPEAALLAARPI